MFQNIKVWGFKIQEAARIQREALVKNMSNVAPVTNTEKKNGPYACRNDRFSVQERIDFIELR
jgi:hypothetical protein